MQIDAGVMIGRRRFYDQSISGFAGTMLRALLALSIEISVDGKLLDRISVLANVIMLVACRTAEPRTGDGRSSSVLSGVA